MPVMNIPYIIYVSEYGTVPSKLKIEGGKTIITSSHLPTLTADGMTFIGWYTSSTFEENTKISVGDSLYLGNEYNYFYAKWEVADEIVFVNESSLRNIANAIRNKTGNSATYQPSQMAGAIEGISTGVDLPTLTNLASELEVFENKEYIDSDGVKRTGTFTIDNELTAAASLVSQIATALEGKAAGGSGGNIETCTVQFIRASKLDFLDLSVFYTDSSLNFINTRISGEQGVIQILKNSILYISGWSSFSTASNGANIIIPYSMGAIGYVIVDDCTLTYALG